MARRKTEHLTPLELEIMHVLWETGPANVQSVQQHLERELAYTTVQTMLNILHREGKVKRTLKDRAYFYKPVVSRSQVVGQHMSDIVGIDLGIAGDRGGRRPGAFVRGSAEEREREEERDRHSAIVASPAPSGQGPR